jgi:sortase A
MFLIERGGWMRLKKLILVMAALTMLVVLAACGSSGGDQGSNQDSNKDQNTEKAKKEEKAPKTTPDAQVAPDQGSEGSDEEASQGPENKMLKVTVPKMSELDNDEVPTGLGTTEALFKNYAGVHLQGTGYPWEKEANVYIAGHRLGFQGTSSYLAFYDIDKLQNGDEIILEDTNGKKYTYVVFNTVVTDPTDLSVLEPVEGKNIVSLQTCTLPDYTDRVIVQGELKA